MKLLRGIGWLFVPFVMIFFRWQNLKAGGRVIAIIWSIIMLPVFINAMFNREGSGEDTEQANAQVTAAPTATPAATQEPSPIPELEAQPPEDLADYVPWMIAETVGTQTNMKLERVIDISIDAGEVFLELVGDDNLTNNMIRSGLLMDSTEIFERVYTDRDDVKMLILTWKFPATDQRGNELMATAMVISMSKENADTHNWEKFRYDNLPNTADSFAETRLLSN